MINLIGQILLGVPFLVFAYWYEQEEALFKATQAHRHTIYRHAAFGFFFSVSFAVLGMKFFPPLTGTTVLLACIYVFICSLDNIEQDRLSDNAISTKTEMPLMVVAISVLIWDCILEILSMTIEVIKVRLKSRSGHTYAQ